MAETNRNAPAPHPLLNLRDELEQETRELEAQLLVTYGGCGPDFRRLAEEKQDAFMEGAGNRATRVRELVDQLGQGLRIAAVRGAATGPASVSTATRDAQMGRDLSEAASLVLALLDHAIQHVEQTDLLAQSSLARVGSIIDRVLECLEDQQIVGSSDAWNYYATHGEIRGAA